MTVNKKVLMFIPFLIFSSTQLYAASKLSHMGQDIQDHVTLVDVYYEGASCGAAAFSDKILVRLNPDGTISTDEFEIPDGQLLVITDVRWDTNGRTVTNVPLTIGNTLYFNLTLSGHPLLVATKTIDTSNGKPGASASLISGVPVGPGSTLCPYAWEESNTGGVALRLTNVTINGYLIETKP